MLMKLLCGKFLKTSKASLKFSRDGRKVKCPKCATWQTFKGTINIVRDNNAKRKQSAGVGL